MNVSNVVMNWSSVKDAALAFHTLSKQPEYRITHLLTTINAAHDRVFMHGTREELLERQAEAMGMPLVKVKLPPSPDDTLYKDAMLTALTQLKEQNVITAAYGDIFLEDLRIYREQQLATAGITAVFPLWQKDTRELVQLVEASGIEAIIVCVNGNSLGKEFLGRKIDMQLINELPAGVDPCGENGEFHTFVYNAPFFSRPVDVSLGATVCRQYSDPSNDDNKIDFYFLDLMIRS